MTFWQLKGINRKTKATGNTMKIIRKRELKIMVQVTHSSYRVKNIYNLFLKIYTFSISRD